MLEISVFLPEAGKTCTAHTCRIADAQLGSCVALDEIRSCDASYTVRLEFTAGTIGEAALLYAKGLHLSAASL